MSNGVYGVRGGVGQMAQKCKSSVYPKTFVPDCRYITHT